MIPVHSQNIRHLAAQPFHIVAVSLLAEAAEAGQILTDLGCGQAHGFCQGAGGDPHRPTSV